MRDILLIGGTILTLGIIYGVQMLIRLFREYLDTMRSQTRAIQAFTGLGESIEKLTKNYNQASEPMVALPTILTAMVKQLEEAKEVNSRMAEELGSFRRLMFSGEGNSLIDQSDQERLFEDEVQETMKRVRCDRAEAISRVRERQVFRKSASEREPEDIYTGLRGVVSE